MKRKKKNRKRIIIAGFLIVVAALLSGYFFVAKSKQNQASAAAAASNNGVAVTTIKISKQQVQLFTELPGRVASYKSAEIRPQVDGIVRKINFVAGGVVKKGQQLYEIDSSIYKSAYNGARSSFRAAKAKRDRYKNLLAQDAISKQEFDDVNANLDQAKSELSKAKKYFDYTKVLAPISGYIGKSNVTEGALVTTNQSAILTTITQLDPIYVDMEQPSKDVIALGHHKKIPVTLTTDDPSYANTGTLSFSEMFADESTDSVRLRAVFSNKDKKLIPGMFVNAKLNLEPFTAITVPQRSTSRAPGGVLTVWIVAEGNVAKPRAIKASKIFQDSWIVEEGLEEGESVIYEGFQKVSDGAKVNPTPLIVPEIKQ